MISCDALIVGGGPAGSTCARLLGRAGWRVVVADRARFPRSKVCAGWLTPDVFPLLDLTPDQYRASDLTLQPIRGFRTGVLDRRMLHTRYDRVVSYAIRRSEFDAFLLRRAGVCVMEGTPIASFERRGNRWCVNGEIDAAVVIGAGGHFCPVARFLRGGRDSVQPVVAREAEVRLDRAHARIDGETPELYFSRDLEGYAWCVRKGDFVNIGVGRRTSHDFNGHLRTFTAYLERKHIVQDAAALDFDGHAYLAAGAGPRPLSAPGMLLVGDSAGIAYPESGEGIKPAIQSGRLAAEVLIAHGPGRFDAARYLEAVQRGHPRVRSYPPRLRPAAVAAGRLLLGSQRFTRRVVLDRWFLRAHG
jgi:geranylgeranyl reductase family protein